MFGTKAVSSKKYQLLNKSNFIVSNISDSKAAVKWFCSKTLQQLVDSSDRKDIFWHRKRCQFKNHNDNVGGVSLACDSFKHCVCSESKMQQLKSLALEAIKADNT